MRENEDDFLFKLKQIEKVSAPNYLKTRIEAKLAATVLNQISFGKLLAFNLALGVLVFININLVSQFKGSTNQNQSETIETTFNINSSNQLYNE